MRCIRSTVVFLAVLSSVGSAAWVVGANANANATAAPRSTAQAARHAFSRVADPARNAAPSPDYTATCWGGGAKGAADTVACHNLELAAINHQHARERVPAIILPRKFWSLSRARQIFVITNLERVSRGLKPVLGINAQMSGWAATGAKHATDPALGAWDLANGTQLWTFAAIWAGDLNVLDADFIWMYADGWSATGSANADCAAAKAAGCWGHREIILGHYSGSAALVAGVASLAHVLAHSTQNSDAEAFSNYTGPKPTLTYTWAQARAAGAH